jgi:hypothetical protein
MRTHISKRQKIGRILPPKESQKIDHKPMGFWWGVDGDWERWCRAEEWGLHGEMFEHELILGDEKLLLLKTVADIDCFHVNYGARILPGLHLGYINWAKVAQNFDGIEIAPYQWDRRSTGIAHSWYYSWDCACGCLWRPRGAKLRLLKTVVA